MIIPRYYRVIKLKKGEDITDIKECPNCHSDSMKLRFREDWRGGTCDNCGRGFVIYWTKELKPELVKPLSAEQVHRLMAGKSYASVIKLDPKDQSAILAELAHQQRLPPLKLTR